MICRKSMTAWVLCFFLGPTAYAIDINITVDNPQDFPTYDPSGMGLNQVAQAAAQIWEELRPGAGTYNINIHWLAFGEEAELGIANGFDGSIRINSDYDWFIDSTPFENEEFGGFTQKFYRDLDGVTKDEWFVDPIPDMLEYSYSAWAYGNGDAAGKYDLLTVVLHEIGHLTGVGWNLLKPDVPLSPQWIGGAIGGAVHRVNESHIIPDGALMDPDTASSMRTLPSALDIMASAANTGHTDVNLQRIDYIGNELVATNLFTDPLAWLGGDFPDVGEQAYIRNGEDVYHPGGNASIDLLRISEYGDLIIFGGQIEVTTSLRLDYGGEVYVGDGATLKVKNLVAGFDGTVDLDGGTLEGENIKFVDTGVIDGHGTVIVEGKLDNSSRIEARDGLLDIQVVSLASLDLDGSSDSGWVVAEKGSIALDKYLADDFDGKMHIAEGQSITTDYYINFTDDSELTFKSSVGGGTALLTAPSDKFFSLSGNIEVLPETTAKIRAGSISLSLFEPTSNLEVWYDSSLSLEGDISYYASQGKIEGEGTLHQDGDAEVDSDLDIEVKVYNWDGSDENKPKNMMIGNHNDLTIASESIDPDDKKYDGEVTLDTGATLTVLAGPNGGPVPGWTLGADGKITLTANTSVGGHQINSYGGIVADKGSSTISADLALHDGSMTFVKSGSTLNFKGDVVRYHGGNVHGTKDILNPDMLQHFSDMHVTEHSTIEVGYFNWDPEEKVDNHSVIDWNATDSGHLTIIAGKIGTHVDLGDGSGEGYGDLIDINSGILEVWVGSDAGMDLPNFWTLRSDGIMNLNWTWHSLPQVMGSLLVNEGLIQGSGQFDNPLLNDGNLVVGKSDGIGLMQFYSTFMQDAGGTLELELGGLGPGTEFDYLTMLDEFHLDGTLIVTLYDTYLPHVGDLFRIIDGTAGGKRFGTFADVLLPKIGAWDVIYGDDYVDLRYTAVPEVSSLLLVGLLAVAVPWVARRRLS